MFDAPFKKLGRLCVAKALRIPLPSQFDLARLGVQSLQESLDFSAADLVQQRLQGGAPASTPLATEKTRRSTISMITAS
jgi:hypothetical protein